jgi:[protein-PII] uridylyltransferase
MSGRGEPARPEPKGLRADLVSMREELAACLERGEDGVDLGRMHVARLDAILRDLFTACVRTAGSDSTSVALAAAGSYGRGAVALRGDADVRVLVPPRSRDAAGAFAEALLYPLWDAGFSIGHQVIDAASTLTLAQTDLTTATTLLDLRHVAGDLGLVTDLLTRAWQGLFDEGELGGFVARLEEEAASRHARFGGSVYLLEPDVKSGAGGLRDLDGARWAARARFRVGDPAVSAQPGGVWAELVRLGVLVTREAHEVAAAETFLWRVRNRLHAHADRRSDRLTFDQQEAIAMDLGYAPESSRGKKAKPADEPAEHRAAAAERLMQDYYLHARVITRARERLLERAVPPRRRGRPVEQALPGGVRLFDGHASLAGTHELHEEPALALRVYAAAVRHGVPVLPFAREAIARAASDAPWAEALRASREAADLFVELVCTVPEVRMRGGSVLSELHDVGLLLAMIPEFKPVTGRVHHDVYHVFTVDAHSVAAVDYLRALARGELAQHALGSRLAAEISRPRPLFLATLLHDVGKGYPDATGSRKNHSKTGAELCDGILPRLGLRPEEVASARALVAQHLAMYHVATRRDLDDPDAIAEFCSLVEGREGLRELYLLTMADLSTTSPTAMTTWKAQMLDQLYFAADAHLAGTLRGAEGDAHLERMRADVRGAWDGPPPFVDAFVASMPERYLLANPAASVAAHARVAQGRGVSAVHAELVPSRHADVAELCVVALDRRGLLSRIAAALTANKLEVLAAQVYSRALAQDGGARGAGGAVTTEAVDLFWVRHRTDGVEGVARAMPRLHGDLERLCATDADPAELIRARIGQASPWGERPSPAVATEVVLDDRASPRHTVVEVFAKDRPGLLFALSRALHDAGLQIALSKINTEGTRVADVFYVNEQGGEKVTGGDRQAAVREALLRAIAEPLA